MKLTILTIFCVFSVSNCGLLKGITETLTNDLHIISESVHNAISNESAEDSSDEDNHVLTKTVDFLGKGAQNVADEIDNTLGIPDRVKSDENETNDNVGNSTLSDKSKAKNAKANGANTTTVEEANATLTTETPVTNLTEKNDVQNNKTEENLKVTDNSTANTTEMEQTNVISTTKTPATTNENNNVSINKTEENLKITENSTANTTEMDQNNVISTTETPTTTSTQNNNKTGENQKTANSSTNGNDKKGRSGNLKSMTMCIPEESNSYCIEVEATRRALFEVGCLNGSDRAADNSCQPIEE